MTTFCVLNAMYGPVREDIMPNRDPSTPDDLVAKWSSEAEAMRRRQALVK